MDLARKGTVALTGVVSGALDNNQLQPVSLGSGIALSWSAIAEITALAVGGGLQFLMPNTLPSISDGLTDGALALVSRRGTKYLMSQINRTGGTQPYRVANPQMRTGALAAPSYGARPVVGGVSNVPRVRVS